MSNDIIERARRDSIDNGKRKKVVRRRKKTINYVPLLLLIASIIINIALIKNIHSNTVNNFSEITFGEDYDKEFEDVNILLESCIKDCIQKQISNDTHRVVDENGINTVDFYYNFTNYNNIFSNLEITINKYQMKYNDTQTFINSIDNLTEEEKSAILVYYGTDFVKYDNNKDIFKRHVGGNLIENNANEQTIEALAEGAVRNLTSHLLDSHWLGDNFGKGL